MVKFGPRKILYVACDPAALARDAKTLAESGYKLDHIQAFDLFPMTQHIECVASFSPVTR
jgi:tRNA/tmRNA/rRNA uracil-C5-methylase (TrmA/RlmC/RlmD family)